MEVAVKKMTLMETVQSWPPWLQLAFGGGIGLVICVVWFLLEWGVSRK